MKNKLKYSCLLIVVIFIFLCGYNIYQYKKISDYKKGLKISVSKNLQSFAGVDFDVENESVYADQYGSISKAQESYIILNNNKGIKGEEWSSSLPGLFIAIKDVMLNDKEKFQEVFEKTDAAKLIFKISNNLEDKDSIKKAYELFSN